MKPIRSLLLASITSVCVLLISGLPNIALLASESYPTAKVNTTGLAVTDTEVTVGQLHSATGTMAISETGSIQAEQLAIEQINAMGGWPGALLGMLAFRHKTKKVSFQIKFAFMFVVWAALVYACWTMLR